MALSEAQLKAREGKVTASFVPYLMAGDADKILREWMRLVGHPDYAPEDLSDKWPVQFGSYIETFALDWHQRKTGRGLVKRGEVVTHQLGYVSCTLDAYREDDSCVIDCKAVGAYRKLDDVCALYLPQIVIQRDCVEADRGSLLIVHGGAEPAEFPCDIPEDYAARVWDRVHAFWRCVEDLTPPVEMPAIAAPVATVKEYDMTGKNLWASEAASWRLSREAAKRFATSEKELKALVPPDAARCFGHGIQIKRNKAGSLSISEAI